MLVIWLNLVRPYHKQRFLQHTVNFWCDIFTTSEHSSSRQVLTIGIPDKSGIPTPNVVIDIQSMKSLLLHTTTSDILCSVALLLRSDILCLLTEVFVGRILYFFCLIQLMGEIKYFSLWGIPIDFSDLKKFI